MAAKPSSANAQAEPLAWIGASDTAIAALAFGGNSRGTAPDLNQLRHLALLPVDALELDLSDPARRQFGDYELLELIGEGGMGVVYRACQISLDREVAVKLLAAGPWASREFIERFMREAQNAARMQHPNIVAIHEVGSAEELHFFSMRLVRGGSLATLIEREGRLAPARAAQLLRTVAEAVDYAHRLGVLHLDLKPANVLLDENGMPHVADFGLARRLDNALAVDNEEVSGTPSYMAPEQAEVRAQKISPATDIWGLGAILYELLTGQPPFRAETAQETIRLVREGHVRSPRRHTPKLPRDLEAIVLKCLERDPAERYVSARALADDLGGFIEHRAVQARPLNALQRIARWTRREPRLAGAAALVAVALVVGLTATTYEWRRAKGSAERAESVRRFLVDVFEHAAPDENQGKPFTAHQLLELGEHQLDKHAPDDPATQADTTALLGHLYIDISDFKRSEALLKRALVMLGQSSIPDDVRARVLLGMARIDLEKGDNTAALGYAQRGLALTAASNSTEAAEAHDIIGTALFNSGKRAEAETSLRSSLAEDTAKPGQGNEFVADQWVELGNVLANAGRYSESEQSFKRAVIAFSAVSGPRSNSVAHTLNELSNMLEDKGDLAGAEKALNEALAIRTATAGPDHHDTLTVESNLLWLLEFEGRYAEALPKRLALLERAERAGVLHDRDRASVRTSLGKDYLELGRFDEALHTLRRSLDLSRSPDGSFTPQSVFSLVQLGHGEIALGNYADAEKTFRTALKVASTDNPPTAPIIAITRASLGDAIRRQHRPQEALAELKAANEAMEATAKEKDNRRPTMLAELAAAQLDAGDAHSAERTARQALEFARRAYPQGHFLTAIPLLALARADTATGHAGEAVDLLHEALEVCTPPWPPQDPRVLEIKVALVAALRAQGHDDEARTLRGEIEPILRSQHTPYAADLRAQLK